jgi:hypothetical protein
MACSYEGATAQYNSILEYINYFFTAIFVVEATLKFIAYGLSYFGSNWNRFDFFVVVASVLDIAMSFVKTSSTSILQLAKILRMFRVTRLFRLINKHKGL